MKRLLLATAAVLVLATSALAAPTDQLTVKFEQTDASDLPLVAALVSITNPTETSFATVAYNCEVYDSEDYVVGRTSLVFHIVPAKSVAEERFVFQSSRYFSSVSCEVAYSELPTKENARLYSLSPDSMRYNLDGSPWSPIK